jgi:cytochrome c oxidase subunit 2
MKRYAALTGCLALLSCSGPQSVLSPAGDQSHWLLQFFALMLVVCGSMFGLVVGFLGSSIWRGRKRAPGSSPLVEPADAGLNRALMVWAGLIVAGLTLLVIHSLLLDRHFAQARALEALDVHVTAQQWWWRIQYRDPATGAWVETANEFHLPIGRTIKVELGSNDVIHSFWVPNLAGKMDVIPGRINTIDLSPDRLGWFRGQCAEFCGLQHAHMALDVKVESQADFDAWLSAQSRPAAAIVDPVAIRGMQVVGTECAACHTIRGTQATGRAGPDLTHLADRRRFAAGTLAFNRGNLEGWIAQPQAIKPGTLMPATSLDPTQADAVARYLETLK